MRKNNRPWPLWFAALAAFGSVWTGYPALGQPVVISPPIEPVPAPPPALPPVVAPHKFFAPQLESSLAASNLYSIGQPTDEEQLYLEYINRARANPSAEGILLRDTSDPDVLNAYAYWDVDTNLMVAQFSTISSAQPLSMNAKLTAGARLHSGDMFTNVFQDHYGSDGRFFIDRVNAQGYSWSTLGENIYSYAKSVFYGHAGFEVDWGFGTGGMQDPPGHRENIHNPAFREVGIGVVLGTKSNSSDTDTVGPQLVTQDFGAAGAQVPFLTGVAYYDLDRNGIYDAGEGLGGITVVVEGSTYWAQTAGSGGYSVPVPASGSYTITFSGPGLTPSQRSMVVGPGNAKVDFVPAYTPPAIAGSDAPFTGINNTYTFSAVGAATAYQWKYSKRISFSSTEGAENGLTNMIVNASAGYEVRDPTVHASGSYSFHLAHPQPADQVLTLKRLLRPGSGSKLSFASRLGWATPTEVARVQASADGGASWTNLWSQAGTESSGEENFVHRTNSLAALAGREVLIRFNYDYTGGQYYTDTDSTVGWHIDDIAVSAAEELVGSVTNDLPSGTTFQFAPPQPTNYLLRVRAKNVNRFFDWGPSKLISAVPAPPIVHIKSGPVFSNNAAQIYFEVLSGTPTNFQLQGAVTPAGDWTTDSSAVIRTNVPGLHYQATTTVNPADHQRYYRILAR